MPEGGWAIPAPQETVRYWGETEAERQAAFQTDAAARAVQGWSAVGQTTEFPFGKPGLDLVVTYERAAAEMGAQPVSVAPVPNTWLPPAEPAQPSGPPAYQRPAAWQWQGERRQPFFDVGRFISGSGPDEPAKARYLRRALVFGGLVTWFVAAGLTESGHESGPPRPSQYPGLAVACFLEAAIALGLAWYLYRWIRLPGVVRMIGVVILAIFFLAIIHMGIQYAIGQLPIEYS